MANVFAVHSVGDSIMAFLRNTYPASTAAAKVPSCSFQLASSGELSTEGTEGTRLTLYLYRITVNEHCRQTHRPGYPDDSPVPLGLDLHYLLTAWAGNAFDEQITLTWAMRQLHQFPVLDASSLSPEAAWAGDEVIQIIPAELSTEDVMRIWDALDPSYRLSVSYVARVVRLDPDVPGVAGAPVVAQRFTLGHGERT